MNKKERPFLSNLVQSNTMVIEKFQNETLRPVIKMQHDILIRFFRFYIINRKIDTAIPKKKQVQKVTTTFGKDIKFKNQLFGLIIGQFSIIEFDFYQHNTTEINRRITQIVLQRIKDSTTEL